MKKLIAMLVTVTIVGSLGLAQEEPIPPKRDKMPKVGLFGGYTPGWLFVDVGPVNEFLLGGKGAPLSDNGVWMNGGAGAVYIMVVKNLRIGGMGAGGGIQSTALEPSGLRRDAELNIGYGGVTLEYVLPFGQRFDIAAGAMIGSGSTTLTLRRSLKETNSWSGEQLLLLNGTDSSTINVTRRLQGSFVTIIPSLNFEYAVLNWLGVRLGASYVWMFSPSWTVDDKYDLVGVPSGIKGSGFMIHAGLLVGTF